MAGTPEEEILAQEEELARAIRLLDIETLERLYADDVLCTGVVDGTNSKAVILEEAKRGIAQRDQAKAAGQQMVTSYDHEDVKVASHGDTAITAYRFVVAFKSESLDVRRRYRRTHVWLKRQERWQIVATHNAFALDPKQAAQVAGESR
jgi:ketosteroid isomerase-like protein